MIKRVIFGWVVMAAVLANAQEAHFIIRGELMPISTAVNGYVQNVNRGVGGEYQVHVATAMSPISDESPYSGIRASADVPHGFTLPVSLRNRLETQTMAWSAATVVLQWVTKHVVLDNNDMRPQDAVSVLRAGRGRCSGLANVTAGLLMASGFEARTISGLLVSSGRAVPHRWVECYLPAAGWVPTDPTLGFWVVTARHIVFAEAVTTIPQIVIVDVTDDRIATLPLLKGRPLRPNQGSNLVCRLALPGVGVVAVLTGHNGVIHRAYLNPEAHFNGLLPGRWELEISQNGRLLQRTEFRLKAGQDHSIVVRDS